MAPRAVPLDVERLLAQSGWARRLARRLVRDPDQAEDVLQETWVAALERPPAAGLRPPADGALRAWLAVVVRNLSLRLRRREAARGEAERGAARHEAVHDPAPGVERLQLQRLLAEALLALEEPNRSAVILRHLDGLSAAEIAARQTCSVAAARQRVSRGLAQLRAELDRRTRGDRAAWCAAFTGAWELALPRALAGAAAPAAQWPAAAAPAATAALCIGGLSMGSKLLAAAVSLGLAVGAWMWIRSEGASPVAPPARSPEAAAAGEARGVDLRQAAAESGPAPLSASTSARERIDVPAGQGAALRGRVRDSRGASVEGALVALFSWNPAAAFVRTPRAAIAEARTDAEGRFEIALERSVVEALASKPFAYVARAELAGYVPAERVVGAVAKLDLVLVERPELRGVLLVPTGEPVRPPGRVELCVVDAAGETLQFAADIDALGRFEARELVPGRLTSVRGRARGFGAGALEPGLELAPGARASLDVTLTPGSVVRGVVVDQASKAPIPFAEVWAEAWTYQPDPIEPSAVADAGSVVSDGVSWDVGP